jgi:hypothetical protein
MKRHCYPLKINLFQETGNWMTKMRLFVRLPRFNVMVTILYILFVVDSADGVFGESAEVRTRLLSLYLFFTPVLTRFIKSYN